jgi:hypothetical protein
VSGRRPLGASLPPAERLVAYEAWIRAMQAAVAAMADAMEACDTGRGQDGRRVSAGRASERLWQAMVEVQEAAEGQIGRKKGPKPAPETVGSR